MRRRWLGIGLLGMLGLGLLLANPAGGALNEANAAAQDTSSPGDVTLTVYQDQNLALIADRRQMTLRKGLHNYEMGGLSSKILSDTVDVNLPDASKGIQLIEQRMRRSEVSPDQLLRDHIGDQIAVSTTEGSDTYRGTLISADNGITLKDDMGRLHVIRNASRITFPESSAVQPSSEGPKLQLRMQSPSSGKKAVQLRYLSEGLNWSPHYSATLSQDRSRLTIKSWVSLENNAGLDLNDVTLRLLAGEVSREQTGKVRAMAEDAAAAQASESKPFEGQSAFEYQLYTLGRPADLPAGQSVRQAFLPPLTVEPTVDYIYDGQRQDGVQVWVETANDNEAAKALPAGSVRMYQKREGDAIFIGKDRMSATPVGEKIRLYAGQAFDLRGKRVRTNREQLGERQARETYEITLANQKAEAVEIEVREHMRGDWTITRSSLPFEKLDAQTATFDVTVPAKGETTLSYTVEFSY
ncbi:MAG: DUF4139 domain-containing protein [Candidatus Bipolaricaulia bacterium]